MKRLKFFYITALFLLSISGSVYGIGVNVAAFLPAHGSLSHPVSPLSFRDVGFTLGKYVGISGAISLYNINGMGLRDPDSGPVLMKAPAVGPFYAPLGSIMVKAILPVWRIMFEPAGGVFGYYLINPALRSGVIDSYIAGKSGFETVDSSFSIANHWGWGFVGGGSISVSITAKIGIHLGAYYYLGSSPLDLEGSFRADGSDIQLPVPSYFTDLLLDFTGIEFVVGGTYEL
ncbi:MAG: hypothetical protein L0213_04865 [Candidatus Dadabacteria bacterium]|nr:hypothetical protein [Candidatus Dadabacteria bacterium]